MHQFRSKKVLTAAVLTVITAAATAGLAWDAVASGPRASSWTLWLDLFRALGHTGLALTAVYGLYRLVSFDGVAF
jgi:hypothetical protein